MSFEKELSRTIICLHKLFSDNQYFWPPRDHLYILLPKFIAQKPPSIRKLTESFLTASNFKPKSKIENSPFLIVGFQKTFFTSSKCYQLLLEKSNQHGVNGRRADSFHLFCYQHCVLFYLCDLSWRQIKTSEV